MALRLGVLGGTFDPVHLGHLRMAEEALESLSLDTLLFIPAAEPPHKSDRGMLPFEDRWRMLELAVGDHPRFRLSDIEHRLSGKSYTVLTLRRLREEVPGDSEIYFLVGMDAFLDLDTWWHYKELFQLARLVILRRPGYPENTVGVFLKGRISARYRPGPSTGVYQHPSLLPVQILANTCLGISSTRIRQLLAVGRSVRYLVPGEILSYIEKKNLYRPVES